MRHSRTLTPVFVLLLLATLAIAGSEMTPPDSEYNAVYKHIEIVDTVRVGESLEVRHTIDPGPGAPKESKILSSHSADDRDVRISVDQLGRSWVVWTRETEISQVVLRQRNGLGGWTSDFMVSEPDEHSFAAEPLHDGRSIWVTYTIDDGEGFGVAVRSGDGPVPWPVRSIIHTIFSRSVEPESRLHMVDGQLLLTWNESRFSLGYSLHDAATGAWSVPQFEDHDGDRDAALQRISTGLH